jgi:hypothetical protein
MVSFLGEEIGVGPLEYEFTDARLEQTEDALRLELQEVPPKQTLSMSWIGGEKSEFIVHRPISGAPPEATVNASS